MIGKKYTNLKSWCLSPAVKVDEQRTDRVIGIALAVPWVIIWGKR